MLDVLLLAIGASTPLLLAAEGELVVQRSGMINLSVEGMLLAAAFGAAFGGIFGGVTAAFAVALLFGLFVIVLDADQIVTGTGDQPARRRRDGRRVSRDAIAGNERGDETRLHHAHRVDRRADSHRHLVVADNARPAPARRRRESRAMRAARWSPAKYRWIALAIEAVLVGLAGTHLALVPVERIRGEHERRPRIHRALRRDLRTMDRARLRRRNRARSESRPRCNTRCRRRTAASRFTCCSRRRTSSRC